MIDTLSFLKREFSDYYSRCELDLPQRFGRREWGFFYFTGSGMQRHLAFNRLEELREFLMTRTPKHAYHSSAYYQNPDMQPMPKKVEGWMGADLIFDLDDEHLSGMENKTPAEKLERVKRIVKDKLLDDFLLTDFGFSEKYLKVVFSGGRGYHIHVFDPKVLLLESPERREIVDYITGLGIQYEGKIFRPKVIDSQTRGGYSKEIRKIEPLADEREGGWRGRMTRGILALLSDMENQTRDDCIRLIRGVPFEDEIVSAGRAKKIYEILFGEEIGKRGVDTIRNEKVIEIFERDKDRDILINLARHHSAVMMAGETDEPVTVDTKRLIRLPGSLHGKTGLKVVRIPITDLDDFYPLSDAIAFDDSRVNVTIIKDTDLELGGDRFKLQQGDSALPKYAAVYLMLRGWAKAV